MQWFKEVYDPNTMDVFVVVGWTESARMEVPTSRTCYYECQCKDWDYFAESGRNYWRINLGWNGLDPEEQELIPKYHRFMVENEAYLEIVSANAVLQVQYLLKSLNVDYVMCNTMHMTTVNKHTQFYIDCVDQNKYLNLTDNSEAFYWKYRDMGYTNPKAKYWHHDEIPHRMFAEELYKFIESKKCLL